MTTWLLAVIQMGTQKVLWGAMGLEVQILYKFNSEEVLARAETSCERHDVFVQALLNPFCYPF